MDKRTNELAMVVKDICSLRDSFEPWLDEVWWKFARTEIKNSSVKKYKWEQFRTWKDLDIETIFVYSINSFWIRLVVFCEFEFGQIVKFVAKSLCTIFEYSSFSWTNEITVNYMWEWMRVLSSFVCSHAGVSFHSLQVLLACHFSMPVHSPFYPKSCAGSHMYYWSCRPMLSITKN